jgi:hypothetical protein
LAPLPTSVEKALRSLLSGSYSSCLALAAASLGDPEHAANHGEAAEHKGPDARLGNGGDWRASTRVGANDVGLINHNILGVLTARSVKHERHSIISRSFDIGLS